MSGLWLITFLLRCLVFLAMLIVGLRLWQYRRSDGPVVEAFAAFFLVNAAAMGWYILANAETALWGTLYGQRYGLHAWLGIGWALWRLWRALHPIPKREEYEG